MDSLSEEGRRLVKDAQDVVQTTREMVREKNADELVQAFVWHTRRVEKEALKPGAVELGPEGEKVQADRDQAVKHLRTIVSLVLTNSEVRKLLADFATIGRDLLARGAASAATSLAPSAEALEHVNEPAPHDQFVTEGGRTAGPGETPVLEARVPGMGGGRMHPREDEPQVWKEGEGSRHHPGDTALVLDGRAQR